MKYETFKKDLYANIIHRKEAKGKQVKLLEKDILYGDEKTISLIRNVNSILYGSPDQIVREDILCIVWGKWEILHLLYWEVQALYARVCHEGWQSVLPEIVFNMQTCGIRRKAEQIGMGNRGYRSERLILRPVNYRSYREKLDGSAFWRFGEIALAPHIFLYEDAEGYETMLCTRDMFAEIRLPDNIILTNALLWSRAVMPPRLYHGSDIRRYFDGSGGVFMPGEVGESVIIRKRNRRENMQGYRLTNARGTDGAVALFYPGVKDRLAELLGGDYYVGFLAAHEVAIHPVHHKVLGDMKESVRRFNALSDEKRVLTDRIYRYCSGRRELIEV